jgi:hypothetical protein
MSRLAGRRTRWGVLGRLGRTAASGPLDLAALQGRCSAAGTRSSPACYVVVDRASVGTQTASDEGEPNLSRRFCDLSLCGYRSQETLCTGEWLLLLRQRVPHNVTPVRKRLRRRPPKALRVDEVW